VLSRVDGMYFIRLLQSNIANGYASDANSLAEHQRGFVIGDVTGTAYERWIYFWFVFLCPTCRQRICKGAITTLVADIAYTLPSKTDWAELSEDDHWWNEQETHWCIKKMFAAMFVYTYKWAVALRAAERDGIVTNPYPGYFGLGFWALPRFYLLRLKDDTASAALYCTHQDVTSVSFNHTWLENAGRRNQPLYEQMLSLWGKALRRMDNLPKGDRLN